MAANEPEFVPPLLSILSPPLPHSPLLRSEADSEAHWGILDNAVCFDEGGEACATWAKEGECRRNAAFMLAACQRSCGMCNLTKLLRTLDARAAADGTLDPLERQPVAEHCQRRRGVCGELRSQASCFPNLLSRTSARHAVARLDAMASERTALPVADRPRMEDGREYNQSWVLRLEPAQEVKACVAANI